MSLLQLTHLPLVYNTFSFGGDDVLGAIEKVLENDDYYETPMAKCIIEIRKKYQNNDYESLNDLCGFYDMLHRNQCIMFEKNHFEKSSSYFAMKKHVNNNGIKRMQIVDALGGVEKVKDIKELTITEEMLTDYLIMTPKELGDEKIMQFEDPAGRKGFCLLYDDKVFTIHQRYRETSYNGSKWVGSSYPQDYSLANELINGDIISLIKKLIN